MNLEKLPEPWRTAMQNRGISSLRDFSRKSDVSVETVRQAVYGTRKSSPATAQSLADTLGVEVAQVNEWLGHGRSDTSAPYEPPAEASRLTQRQRKALDELIRSMTVGAHHDREGTSQQGAQEGSPQHSGEDSAEDGRTSRRGTPIGGDNVKPLRSHPHLVEPPAREDADAAWDTPNRGAEQDGDQDHDAERPEE